MSESTTNMGSAATPVGRTPGFERIYVWELPVRIFHWVNATCLTILFATGLYIAHPVLTGSGEAWNSFLMGRVRQVHFATAYVFTLVLLWRLVWIFVGNEYAHSGVPRPWRRAWWRELFRQGFQYMSLDTGKPQLGHNELAGLSYAVFIWLLGLAQALTGFALYSQSSPGGFWDGIAGWVTPLLGGVYNTVMWHHLFAWGFATFVVLHVYIVLFDNRVHRSGGIRAMIDGHKFRRIGEKVRDE